MISDQQPKIQMLRLGDIDVEMDSRIRGVSEAGVESLIASIQQIGTMTDPVKVRRKRRESGETLVLLAGAHRLEAAKRLGWETIPARVWADITDVDAKLIEIDDNIAGQKLGFLEEIEFLTERKRVYEEVHPETKRGAAGNRARHGKLTPNSGVSSFVEATAEATGVSKSKLYARIAVGNYLTKEEFKALRAAPNRIKSGEFDALRKVTDPALRSSVIQQLATGEAKSVKAALASLDGSAPSSADPIAAAYKRLMTDWRRAPMAAKRSFLDEIEPELLQILNGKPELKAI